MHKNSKGLIPRLLLYCLLPTAFCLLFTSTASAQVSYTSAYLTDLNYNSQFPCGDPTQTTPTGQINTTLHQAAYYGGGVVDWTCYQKAFEIDQDIFSSISANILIWGGEHAVTVNANATIPANFEICFGPGGSIAAGLGFTLTNNSTPCLGSGPPPSSCPGVGATPTQILYDLGGACVGIPTSAVDTTNRRVSWEYYESFGNPIGTFDASFGDNADNYIADISVANSKPAALAVYEQDANETGMPYAGFFQTLEIGDEALAHAIYAIVDTTGLSGVVGIEISAQAHGTGGDNMIGEDIGLVNFGAGTILSAMGLKVEDVAVSDPAHNFSIFGGLGLYDFGDWVISGTDTLANLTTQTATLPGEGFQKNCSNCDTPAYAGAPCTSAGDMAGAVAVYIQSGLYCYGKAGGGAGTSWSSLTNPVGTLTLDMGSYTSEFDYDSFPVFGFTWKTTTAATATVAAWSPYLDLCGNAWHAGGSVSDCAEEILIPGNGTDAGAVLNFLFASTAGGPAAVSFPYLDLATTTVGALHSAADYPGYLARVSNSTAITNEGQTCVAGGTTIALAFSDGTGWFCFGQNTGSGGIPYPGAGVAVSNGSAWLTSLGLQGTDVNALSAGTITGVGASLCTDALGGATTAGCPAGAGSPGGSATNLQYYVNATTFGGMPGSTVDAVNGLLTLAPIGTGIGLTVTGDSSSSSPLSTTSATGGAVFITSLNSDAASLGLQVGSEITDNLGSNVEGTAISANAILSGSNTADDLIEAIYVDIGSLASAGAPGEMLGILLDYPNFSGGNPAPVILGGLDIHDQAAGVQGSTMNAAILINDQTPGPTVWAIHAGLGLYLLGDWVSWGTDTLANLTTQMASLPTEGFVKWCSDCDTPAYDGAVCTDSGDMAGAQATYIQGALYCSGKASGGGGAPGGSGTEVQYRLNATTFGGVPSSSVDAATGAVGFSATTAAANLEGLSAIALVTGASARTDAFFAQAQATGSGDPTALEGVGAEVNNLGTGAVTGVSDFHARAITNTGGGSIAYAAGMTIDAVTVGTTQNYAIFSGEGLMDFGDWSSPGTDTLVNLTTQMAALPSEGFSKNCSDCDTPPYDGAVCTDSGDNAGAVATFIQGALYCSGKATGAGGGITNGQVTAAAATWTANTCVAQTPLTMTGVIGGGGGTAFSFTPDADVTAIVGWGSTGGLTIAAYPTTNTLNWAVCNQTASPIIQGSNVVFNVSAR